MQLLKKYRPSIVMIMLGFIFLLNPEFSAFILGGLFLSLAFGYAWLQFKWQARANFVKNTHFEEEIFSQGEPSIKNISMTIYKRYS